MAEKPIKTLHKTGSWMLGPAAGEAGGAAKAAAATNNFWAVARQV